MLKHASIHKITDWLNPCSMQINLSGSALWLWSIKTLGGADKLTLCSTLSIVNSSIPVVSVFMNHILNVRSFSLLLLIHNSDLCIIPSGYFYLIMLVWYVNCGQHKYVPGSILMITDWILCSCIILSSRIRFPIYVSSS